MNFLTSIVKKIEVKYKILNRAIGRNTVKVPFPVRSEKRPLLTLKVLVNAVRSIDSGKKFNYQDIDVSDINLSTKRAVIFGFELKHAHNEEGKAIESSQGIEKIAQENKDFMNGEW